MLLRQCLLAFSALTATACLTLFDAKASLAATFYNFQLNFSDGTSGNGSFSTDETTPGISSNYSYNGYTYDSTSWNFLDFNFAYAGKNYTKSDLSYSYLTNYTFPTTSNYYPDYGDTLKIFSFELPSLLYAYGYDYAPNSIYSDFVYGYNSSSGAYVTSGSWQQVPTPALLPGLIGMGVVALRKRKKEAVAEPVEESVAA